MPYAERIRSLDGATRQDVECWLADALDYMYPANSADIAGIINGLFEAFDVPVPSPAALKHWFNALGMYPAWALEKAVGELILEQSFTPKIADVVRRVNPIVAPMSTLIIQVRMLLDYGSPPEPEEPATEEQKQRVRSVLEAAGFALTELKVGGTE